MIVKSRTEMVIRLILAILIPTILVLGVLVLVMCTPLLPWVLANNGECLTGLCPEVLGCLK